MALVLGAFVDYDNFDYCDHFRQITPSYTKYQKMVKPIRERLDMHTAPANEINSLKMNRT